MSTDLEDYAVYAALVDGLGGPEDPEEAWKEKQVFVQDVTGADRDLRSHWGRWGFRSKSKAAPGHDTVVDFERKARSCCVLKPQSGDAMRYKLISKEELDKLSREGIGRISLSQFPSDRVLTPATRRNRVLIVDDNYFVRQTLSEIFRREADFDVCGEAVNGHEAVKAAPLLHPDLIVLDLAMPVMNGLDAARKLRRLMPAVPIMMYSGIGDKFVEQQARFIGIAALIAKAEPPGTLIGTARTVLAQR